MSENKQGRDGSIDLLRGFAILIVVLGHTITGLTSGSENSAVYRVIWSLQMPLFFLISGYCFRFSRPIASGRDLGAYIVKRSAAYLLPWCVWTFLIRGIIFGQSYFLDPGDIFFHMDKGYWFLASLWTLSLFLGVSSFLSAKMIRNKRSVSALLVTALFYALLAGLLVLTGRFAGMGFFGARLTLYYAPFYFAGYLYSFAGSILSTDSKKKITDIAAALCAVVYIVLMTRFNILKFDDSVKYAALRMIISLTGCIAVCGTLGRIRTDNRGASVLTYTGRHSLEIYLMHYLLLSPLKPETVPKAGTLKALGSVSLNYILTLGITFGIILLLSQNTILQFILFGKKKKNASESIDRRDGSVQ